MCNINPEAPLSGQCERSGSDRRSHIDRRRTVAPLTGPERRSANRRHAIDRRGLPYGVHFKTGEPLIVLYRWLRRNCIGKWSVGLESDKKAQDKKSVKALFEIASDKDKF